MAKGGKNKPKAKTKSSEPDAKTEAPDEDGPTEFDAQNEGGSAWGGTGGMGDWDVPDQPVHFETASHHASIRSRSPAPSTSMFPSNGGMPMPAPSFQFGAPPPAGSTSPRVASLSGRGQPGSPIPPSMAMHLNSSPTAFGAGNPLPTTWGARYNSPSVRSARQFTSPRGKPASISSSSRANIATMLGETANGKLRPGGSRGSGPGLSMQEQLELNRTSPYAEPRSFIDGPPMSMPTAVPFGGVDPERASVLSNARAPGGGPPLTGFGGMDGIPPHLAAAFQGGQPGSEGFHPEEQPPQAVPLDEAPPRAPSRSSSIFKKVLGSRSNSPTQDRKKPKAGRKPSQSSIPVHSPIPEQSVEDLPDAPPHTAASWGAWPSAPPETEDHEGVGGKREYEEHVDDGHWGAGGHASANENPNHREWGQADGPPGSSLAWGNRTSYTHSQLGHNPGPGRSVKFDDGSHSHHPHEGMSVSEHGEVRPPSIAPDVSSSWDQHAQGPLSDRGGALDDEDDDAPPPVQPLSGDWGEGGSLPGVSVAAGSHFTGGPPPPSLFSAGAGLPIPKGSTVQIDSSNGRAMEPAELALFGKHRVAEERIIWTLPFAHDPRVHWMHDFIERFHYAIATFGFNRFIRARQKGALFVNVDYARASVRNDPAFDWLSFDQCRHTRDRTIQRSIAANNPARTCLVFMFLLSKSGNSMGMWRRRLEVPESVVQEYRAPLRVIEADLRDVIYDVKVDPRVSELPPAPRSPRSRSPLRSFLPSPRTSPKTRTLPYSAMTTITAPSTVGDHEPVESEGETDSEEEMVIRKKKKKKKELKPKKGNWFTRCITWDDDEVEVAKIKKKRQ